LALEYQAAAGFAHLASIDGDILYRQ
jgi:hypothetical protein